MSGERLFKRAGGRVWYGWFYEDLGGGRERVQRSTRCTDKRAAETVVRGWERAAADPDHAAAHGALMRHALVLVVERAAAEHKAGEGAEDTVAYYERKVGHLSRFFEPEGQPFPLARLRASHVDDYIALRRSEPARDPARCRPCLLAARRTRTPRRAPPRPPKAEPCTCERPEDVPRVQDSTIAKELGALRRALRLAKRRGLWRGDIDEIMPVDFGSGYKPRERWLPLDEVQRLLAELGEDHAARVAFVVALGARDGEAERARREDLTPWLVLLRGTKTEGSLRTVPVVLDEQVELLAFAFAQAQGDDALFVPWGNSRRGLAAACARAGIERCSWNDLRRTYTHLLRQRGIPTDLVAPAMGHVDTRMVEKVYGRMHGAELLAAMVSAAAHVQQPLRSGWHSLHSLQGEKRENPVESVPRDGIEPPTRGFSSRVRLLLTCRKDTRKPRDRGADAAPMQQAPRLRAVRGGRS